MILTMNSLFDAFTTFGATSPSPYTTSYPQSHVLVVSDSQYQEVLKQNAEREVLVLENRINRYKSALESLEAELVKVRTKAGILPATEDTTT